MNQQREIEEAVEAAASKITGLRLEDFVDAPAAALVRHMINVSKVADLQSHIKEDIVMLASHAEAIKDAHEKSLSEMPSRFHDAIMPALMQLRESFSAAVHSIANQKLLIDKQNEVIKKHEDLLARYEKLIADQNKQIYQLSQQGDAGKLRQIIGILMKRS